MKITSAVRVKVEAGGSGVVAHVGLHALGGFADRLGLADALSSRIRSRSTRALHDRGKVLVADRTHHLSDPNPSASAPG